MAAAAALLRRAADEYATSWHAAPPGSWGRPIAMLRCRLMAGDLAGARADAGAALDASVLEASGPIGGYCAALALLVLGRDDEAARFAERIEADGLQPVSVAHALGALARGDAEEFADGPPRGARVVRGPRRLPRGRPRGGHRARARRAGARARRRARAAPVRPAASRGAWLEARHQSAGDQSSPAASSRARVIAAWIALRNAARTPADSSSRIAAIVVPPGDVTISRSSTG